jgi:hypothetical protein
MTTWRKPREKASPFRLLSSGLQVVVLLRHVLGPSSSLMAVVLDEVCRSLRVVSWAKFKELVLDVLEYLVAVPRSESRCELLCESLACLTGDRSQTDCVCAAMTPH